MTSKVENVGQKGTFIDHQSQSLFFSSIVTDCETSKAVKDTFMLP